MKTNIFQNEGFFNEVKSLVHSFSEELENGAVDFDEANYEMIKGLIENLKESFALIDKKKGLEQLSGRERARFIAELNLFMSILHEIDEDFLEDEDFDEEEFEINFDEDQNGENSKS